jgi:hypothetical protein
MLDDFATLYKSDAPQWSSIEELTNTLNWTEIVSLTGAEYFLDHGVSQKLTTEFIEAATRVNYAQVRHALDRGFSAELSYAECRWLTRIRSGLLSCRRWWGQR